jgi:glycosyltransferase involved in cell wall biosynthesis
MTMETELSPVWLAARNLGFSPEAVSMGDSGMNGGPPLRWVRKAVDKTAWAARKFGYYFLPPAMYDSVRFPRSMVLPRVFQPLENARLKLAVQRRFGTVPPPAPVFTPPPPPPLVVQTDGSPPVPVLDRDAVNANSSYQSYHAMSESRIVEVEAKLARCREVAQWVKYDRVRMYREIARLERILGNDLKAALYKIRCMRLSGYDRYDDLPWVQETLVKNKYIVEAEVVHAMYASNIDRDAECGRLLVEARQRLLKPPVLPDEYSIWDDRRGDSRPRVSVLMTLYNGANKLAHFLGGLQLQTLNRKKQIELIIVDSNSPLDEYAAWKQVELTYPIPTLFARTKNRETIQTAWNRALPLARAPYISLLGVDEAIVPQTLEKLANVLDAELDTDWAQGSILSTMSDSHGNQDTDVMTYDKTGYSNDMVYLETCYLGPVGAVHRKSLHDRLGYFDGSFRGAGDTEFKNRILPGLKVTTVPDLLGLYINYPEERATQSPAAELEDSRAWYLHRTPAGIKYAYADRPVEDLERQLSRCLWYRKSYSNRHSTDFMYAEAMTKVLRDRAPTSAVLERLGPGVEQVCRAYRNLDFLPSVQPEDWYAFTLEQRNAIFAILLKHRAMGIYPADIDYWYFNDNINEQHHWFW